MTKYQRNIIIKVSQFVFTTSTTVKKKNKYKNGRNFKNNKRNKNPYYFTIFILRDSQNIKKMPESLS